MRASLEVADIFRAAGPRYRVTHAGHLSLDQLKVMSAIETCPTAIMGGHVEACTDCGHWRIACNSCRNRHCPRCQGAAARTWLAEREADLLPVGFGWAARLPWQSRPSRRPACVPAPSGPGQEEALGRLCQAAVRRPRDGARLSVALPHRVAISNSRLLRLDETGVTFRYKNYRADGADRQQVITLSAHEFIRRFLLHVLPKGFHRIRHYGLLAGATRKAHLARARELLGVAPPPVDPIPAVETDDARPPCPCCGGRMLVIETFERWCRPRAPPHSGTSTGTITP